MNDDNKDKIEDNASEVDLLDSIESRINEFLDEENVYVMMTSDAHQFTQCFNKKAALAGKLVSRRTDNKVKSLTDKTSPDQQQIDNNVTTQSTTESLQLGGSRLFQARRNFKRPPALSFI